MSDLDTVEAALRDAKAHGHPIDVDVALTLLSALQSVEHELLLLRDLTSDVDEFFDSPEGDLFQPGHNCRCQRRTAQFYEQVWKKSAEARGYKRVRETWGRGRG